MENVLSDIIAEEDEEEEDTSHSYDNDGKYKIKTKPTSPPTLLRGATSRFGAALAYAAPSQRDIGVLSSSPSSAGLLKGTTSTHKRGVLQPNSTIFDTLATKGGVPIATSTRTAEPPVWLLSSSALVKNPPQMRFDTLGMHILDYGFGPHALVTVHALDDEMSPHHTLEQQSRTGVLGRIVAGVWSKVAEVSTLCRCESKYCGVLCGHWHRAKANVVASRLIHVSNNVLTCVGHTARW